jgi:uncharacterized protein
VHSANVLCTPNGSEGARRRAQTCVNDPKIWIDLDNSPHVPFFLPIIEELEKHCYPIVVTARDCYQVRELADLNGLKYKLIGRHYGKNKFRKMFGLGARAVQLLPTVLKEKPTLAISHGSRSQLVISNLLRIPSLLMVDYESANKVIFTRPTWYMCPEVLPDSAFSIDASRILKYPGIKEDIYVRRLVPDSHIRADLGLTDEDLVVTMRPPATEAHYHRPESDKLFDAVVNFLRKRADVKMVLLPRNEKQAAELRSRWGTLFAAQVMRIPQHVVDGLNLIWNSDFVVSGGGTMNREAAALGVPVYSTFRGAIGAVDRYLSSEGRLVLLECVEDAESKIQVTRRDRASRPQLGGKAALRKVIDWVVAIVEHNSSCTFGTSASIQVPTCSERMRLDT